MGTHGDGAEAWEALIDRFDSNCKDSRRALREELSNAVLHPGQDPADYFAPQNARRARLAAAGNDTISDDSYADIILRGLTGATKEHDYIRQMSHRNRTFGLEEIQVTVVNMFTDKLSRQSPSRPSEAVVWP